MAIVRWDPFGEMLQMQREMDRIYGRMGLRAGEGGGQGGMQGWMPKLDIKQSGDDMQIHAELPGVKPEDVDIEVTEGVLTIRGERRMDSEQKEGEDWLVRERSYGSFQRAIALPESVDPNSITAKFTDGVLELTVPKAFEQAQPQTTKVQIGQGQRQAMGAGTQSRESTQMPQSKPQTTQGQPEGEPEIEGHRLPEYEHVNR